MRIKKLLLIFLNFKRLDYSRDFSKIYLIKFLLFMSYNLKKNPKYLKFFLSTHEIRF